MTQKRFHKLTVKDVPLKSQTVLLRADYNVPLDADGKIADEYRITRSLPTLEYLLQRGCKVVVCAHLGRPDGQVKKEFTLLPVAERLAELLDVPVEFVADCTGDKVVQAVKKADNGSLILLENLRYYPEEEANDSDFAAKMAKDSGARYFVQDGFGIVHRAHASTSAITGILPSVAGLLIEKEYTTLTNAMRHPEKPLVAILGGAKISDKIDVFNRFIDIADTIIVGGAMANTFLKYKGFDIGASKFEDLHETVKNIYDKAETKVGSENVDDFLVLPSDVTVAESASADAVGKTVAVDRVGPRDMILDIGPISVRRAVKKLDKAKTVIWNGTLGYAELPQFAEGSTKIAEEISARKGAVTSIIGGGDTADFILDWSKGDLSRFSHISTGGGAALELMEGKKLPGIEALLDD